MRFVRFIIPSAVVACFSLSQQASAKPVYLSCRTVENGNTEPFNIAADEATGMVTVSDQTGSQSMRASFSEDQVTFGDGVIWDYVLNRVNLSIAVKRYNGSIERGRCQIAAPRRRAF